MDDFAEGGLSLADDILLEDYPYEDDCICTPDFTTDDYVRVTQLYYEGVVSRLVNSTLEQFLWHMY
jgi:E3 ubiquitin-protein ligase TTC3